MREQRAFAGAVAADEPDLDVVGQRGLGAVEQHLVAVALAGVLDLQQHSHAELIPGEKAKATVIVGSVGGRDD